MALRSGYAVGEIREPMGYIRAQLEEGADAVRQALYMAVFMTLPFPSSRMSGDDALPPCHQTCEKRRKITQNYVKGVRKILAFPCILRA